MMFSILLLLILLTIQAKPSKHVSELHGAVAINNNGDDSIALSIERKNTRSENKRLAKENHAFAMDRINQNDYQGALPYFRLACRLDPDNIVFWNDLGVTEMRSGDLHKAKTRFLKAVELDPNFQTGHENINEIKQFLGEEQFNAGLKRRGGKPVPLEHHTEAPPEMSAEEFFKISIQDDIDNGDILGAAPIVIRGAAQAWGWNLQQFSLQQLVKHFGGSRVDYYPHNMQVESVHPFFASLENAIRWLQRPESAFQDVDVSEPGTYIQWNIEESTWRDLLRLGNITLPVTFDDLHWTPKCFNTTKDQTKFNINIHWKMLLVGEQGAGMFNHKDVLRMASWQVQVAGRKKWHLCSSDEDDHLSVHMNVLYPDYTAWPQLRKARCFTTIVNKGDMLYYPRDWWHQTENLDTPSIALSGSMVNRHNHLEFIDELETQCGPNGRNTIFIKEPDACGDIERCVGVWKGMYGTASLDRFVGEEL